MAVNLSAQGERPAPDVVKKVSAACRLAEVRPRALFDARSGAGFVKFIHGVTDPLYLPFKGIVASPSLEGGYTLAAPLLVAILVYAMLHLAIKGLLRLIVQRKTEI